MQTEIVYPTLSLIPSFHKTLDTVTTVAREQRLTSTERHLMPSGWGNFFKPLARHIN